MYPSRQRASLLHLQSFVPKLLLFVRVEPLSVLTSIPESPSLTSAHPHDATKATLQKPFLSLLSSALAYGDPPRLYVSKARFRFPYPSTRKRQELLQASSVLLVRDTGMRSIHFLELVTGHGLWILSKLSPRGYPVGALTWGEMLRVVGAYDREMRCACVIARANRGAWRLVR